MAHERGHESTIRLYGWVEIDLSLFAANIKENELDNLVEREIQMTAREMKEDFFNKYRQINRP